MLLKLDLTGNKKGSCIEYSKTVSIELIPENKVRDYVESIVKLDGKLLKSNFIMPLFVAISPPLVPALAIKR